eukprot:scaffold17789_cov34-Attheya_sp.AAC.1
MSGCFKPSLCTRRGSCSCYPHGCWLIEWGGCGACGKGMNGGNKAGRNCLWWCVAQWVVERGWTE